MITNIFSKYYLKNSGFFSDTLVTGASGFLGRCLREFLVSDSGINPNLFDLDHTVLPDSGISNIFHLAALVSVLIDELERRAQRYGCIAICGAAGVASAMVIERLAA